MNDLQIVVSQQPGVISTNFEEIKESLTAQMQIYKELEVTEENKAERKKDVATLRKMQKTIVEKKSEVRNACLKPYEGFNEQANALAEIINEPIKIIDNQVKEFEEKQRLAKIEEIKKIYTELIGDLEENLPLDKVYENKWENTATSKKAIKVEMTEKIDKVRQDVKVITSMVSDKTDEALTGYWVDLSLSRAVATINSYEEYKKKIIAQQEEKQRKEKEVQLERERERIRDEERKKIHEEERIREEERRKASEQEERTREDERRRASAAEERIRDEERLATEKRLMGIKEPSHAEPVEMFVDDLEAPFVVSDEVTTIFAVTGTSEELQQVEMYLNSIGLLFERKDA